MKNPAPGPVPLQLFDPRRGDVAFKIAPIRAPDYQQPQRNNFFTVLWVQKGRGTFHVDLQSYAFAAPTLLFVTPYQTFFLAPDSAIGGTSIQFHANFFCIETYHEEVGCNGVLFNDLYGRPVIALDDPRSAEFASLIAQMEKELQTAGLAHSEILLSYLKVFLIKATRHKIEQQECTTAAPNTRPPAVLDRLTALIEEHYPHAHSPADYAAWLHLSPKALGKIVKSQLGKTLTTLIRERILKHAKWQLLHTRKPVKGIAAEVGFDDELYFSRLFKRGTGFSPSAFREFETAIRSGRNLSM
ncbi:transcriptional regulator, AraC family [Chthoniobacter flavus Ellin428]|uniref:Transcriptional regulator, AraC family n=1 Tax=Chthoniobacter flavus Ellin428 TaxID=497964 RepID=B4CX13_9BACT|nr:AraC family transcriptional regulator [Chthoniobacter flavus]EDY21333.1 transcriptional regulator, AraC family [Chthoniobacter flavus Ellin428]TCO84899.1 AraC-like DNA-binding protein [Chthoniobacter flavus]